MSTTHRIELDDAGTPESVGAALTTAETAFLQRVMPNYPDGLFVRFNPATNTATVWDIAVPDIDQHARWAAPRHFGNGCCPPSGRVLAWPEVAHG